MKSLTLLSAAVFLMTIPGRAFAQGSKPEKEAPPDPPLLASAPASSQWAIIYSPKTPPKEPTTPEEIRAVKLRQRYSPTLLAKRVLKLDGEVVFLSTYEAGLKSESWNVGKYLCETPLRDGDDVSMENSTKTDFPEIYWVNAENFRGTSSFKGRKVHVYETESVDPNVTTVTPAGPVIKFPDGTTSADPVSKKIPPQRAYIDAESRLPISVDAGPTVWTYQYGAAPSSLPTPDPRIQKVMIAAGIKPPKTP